MGKIGRSFVVAMVVGLLAAGLSGCQKKEGPAERAGKAIDKAAEKAGQELGKAVEKSGEKLEKAGEKIKDAAKGGRK